MNKNNNNNMDEMIDDWDNWKNEEIEVSNDNIWKDWDYNLDIIEEKQTLPNKNEEKKTLPIKKNKNLNSLFSKTQHIKTKECTILDIFINNLRRYDKKKKFKRNYNVILHNKKYNNLRYNELCKLFNKGIDPKTGKKYGI